MLPLVWIFLASFSRKYWGVSFHGSTLNTMGFIQIKENCWFMANPLSFMPTLSRFHIIKKNQKIPKHPDVLRVSTCSILHIFHTVSSYDNALLSVQFIPHPFRAPCTWVYKTIAKVQQCDHTSTTLWRRDVTCWWPFRAALLFQMNGSKNQTAT